MNLYSKITKNGNNNAEQLPSVAMVFDGMILENEIEGYTTLNVSGRETVSYSTTTAGHSNEIVEKKLNSRTLQIQYELKADTNEEFQERFRELNQLLETENEDVEIRFADDLKMEYKGQLVTMSDVPPEANVVVGTFDIYCASAWKEEDEILVSGNPLNLYLQSKYRTKPKRIELNMNTAANKVTVDNLTTGRHIILDGSYKAGDTIIIEIPENKITKNGQNIMTDLNYKETDFHKFLIKTGDVIQTTPGNTDMEIAIRTRWK
jgi:predicted phage tail component-like protein